MVFTRSMAALEPYESLLRELVEEKHFTHQDFGNYLASQLPSLSENVQRETCERSVAQGIFTDLTAEVCMSQPEMRNLNEQVQKIHEINIMCKVF